jgi:hypothetical protein
MRVFDSQAGPLRRGVAVVLLGQTSDGQEIVREFLALFDAAGRPQVAAFQTTASFDGRLVEAGEMVPASIRSGVLEPALRLGRILPAAAPPGWVVRSVSAEARDAGLTDVRQVEPPQLAPTIETRSVAPSQPREVLPPAEPGEHLSPDWKPADEAEYSAGAGASDPPAATPGPSPDDPAWYAFNLNEAVSQRIMRLLKRADIRTAGDLDRYATARSGDLSGLELSEGQRKSLTATMGAISRGEDPTQTPSESDGENDGPDAGPDEPPTENQPAGE